jgi:hypothetical protein
MIYQHIRNKRGVNMSNKSMNKEKAHNIVMQLADQYPELSSRKLTAKAVELGYEINHVTVYRWLLAR